ncbi:MAG: sigma-70 family RNA polymerase sigma factor [Myxococcales bacterium]|nr:sigma-70 family RNA polymerase sigma factor [Myxococcales bacterium]
MTAPAPSLPDVTAPPPFRAVYDAHFDHVWHTLRRLGVAARDLEDAAHEVFVVVHRKLRTDFDASRPVRPWLTGIAYRVAADERRRARHHRERLGAPDLAAVADPGPAPDRVVEAREARAEVQAALEALDLEKRVIFVMSALDGEPCPAIAEALGLPLNTVYSRLRVARQTFAAAVRRRRFVEGVR